MAKYDPDRIAETAEPYAPNTSGIEPLCDEFGRLVLAPGSGGGGGGGDPATLTEQQTQTGLLTTIANAADVPTSDVIDAVNDLSTTLGAGATIADVVAKLTTDEAKQTDILAKLTAIEVDTTAAVSSLLAIEADADATRQAVQEVADDLSQNATGFISVQLSNGTSFLSLATVANGQAVPTNLPTLASVAFGKRAGAASIDPIATSSLGNGAVLVAGVAVNTAIASVQPVPAGVSNGSAVILPLADASGRGQITHNRIARLIHVASATLPAAGAFTNQALFSLPEGVVGITVFITYTRGAVGGKVRLRPVFGNGTETARQTSVTSSVESGGTVVDQIALRDIDGPIVDTASAIVFELHFDVPFGATTFALYGAEKGVEGTPGTFAAAITSRYGV
jgi:hypothetical protein